MECPREIYPYVYTHICVYAPYERLHVYMYSPQIFLQYSTTLCVPSKEIAR